MAERVILKKVEMSDWPHIIPVVDHPRIFVYDKWDNYSSGVDKYGGTLLGRVEYFGIHIDFQDKGTDDTLQVYFAETLENFGNSDGMVMVVGTKKTGDRLTLGTVTRREVLDYGVVRYGESHWWNKVDDDDEAILITSREAGKGNHLLDNRNGQGYRSPLGVTLELTAEGEIVITPQNPPLRNKRPAL